ncbi:MAG TPA: glycoside hydrolase family 15 protein [Thiobacillus sp.]
MPRDLPIGNGSLLASFDLDYQIRDFYYPRVGKENHALGYPWRFGVWLAGEFSWLGRDSWTLERDYVPDTLVTAVTASHRSLPLRLHFNDTVDYEKNILLRQVRVRNLSATALAPRLFFHTDLNALENEIGDTVFFDPRNACLVHYKGPRYFMMSCATEAALGVSRFATGGKRYKGLEGSWRDAEDGELSGNPIAQGAVDSVIGIPLSIPPGREAVCHYWLGVGESYRAVEELHHFVTRTGPERLIARNIDYWRHWITAGTRAFPDLPQPLVECYQRSLLILRTQIDHGGAVLAANDTDIRQFNQDTYSYVWPRDGAIVCQALDRAGYGSMSQQFLTFCTQAAARYSYSASILADTGFLMHKYNPDGSVGSSWQPWLEGEEMVFPIQEDETALVIWAIWHHYAVHRDIEAIRPLYNPFVEQAADFLLGFRDDKTGLPLPSYDLWEERRGVFTFTAAAVIAGLRAAADLATLFQDEARAEACLNGARDMRQAVDQHLWCPREGRFARGIVVENGVQTRDATVDASLLGLVIFGGYDPLDPRMVNTTQAVEQRLWVQTGSGGLARYDDDGYQRAVVREGVPGNPWIVCTLWLAQVRIAAARNRADLERAVPLLAWAAERALPSGVLPEQVHPLTGEFLSVSPLTWSHGTLVAAMLDYADKADALRAAEKGAASGQHAALAATDGR